MERPAREMVEDCRRAGIDPYKYGADLVRMAAVEQRRNLWAVRWTYHHILRGGLCLRPPHSMVDHVGLGGGATNVGPDPQWSQPQLAPCPKLPAVWPPSVEHPDCARLWREAAGTAGPLRRFIDRLRA